MIQRKEVEEGDLLLWHPTGVNDYYLMLYKEFADTLGDEWVAVCLNTGETEDINVTNANSINWTRIS